MTLLKSFCLAAVAAGLLFAGEGAARAADDCLAQVKALAPTVEKVTDTKVKAKAEELLKKAENESIEAAGATEEAGSTELVGATEEDAGNNECMGTLQAAKELLGVK